VRVVLDTNVVVSALIWGGTPYRLIEAAADGGITLYTSPILLSELREVLSRPHLASRLIEHRSTVDQALQLYANLAIAVTPLEIPVVVPGDTDDDHVIAAALAAKARLVVSGDRHLLSVGNLGELAIVTPAEAVARLGPTPPRPRGSGA
jgi:putative PIN family toxin of toxin-antitoxin system